MKQLIVNADDFGYTPGVNRAIAEASRAGGGGIITATSLLANAAAFDDAVELARRTPELDIGCHLNLVEGRPVAPAAEVAGLLDRAGNFAGASALALALLSGRARLEQIERECAAQVERVIAAGIRPSHLDTHQHTHLHPRVARAVARTARRFSIRWVRRPFESISLAGHGKFKRRLLAGGLKVLAGSFDRVMTEQGIQSTRHFTGFVLTGRLTAEALRLTLERLPEGTTELMCHPGYADAALTGAATNLREHRQRELDALRDPRMQAVLAGRGIALASFRELAASQLGEAAPAPGVEVARAAAGRAEAGRT
jgi:hopanoid biosynthesis associated protein HpnK